RRSTASRPHSPEACRHGAPPGAPALPGACGPPEQTRQPVAVGAPIPCACRSTLLAAEIAGDHLPIMDEVRGLPAMDDGAGFEDITEVGTFERRARILLDQQDRHPELAQGSDDAEDLAHDQRRKAEARLVEQ